MFHKLIKGIAPLAGIALAAAVAGCGDMDVKINGEEGVPLAELDMSGDAPDSVLLAGPDKVVITDGAKLAIDVAGDSGAAALVRFTLKDGTLGILREKGEGKVGTAIVNVTMPAPKSLTIAGSGTIETEKMTGKADINVLGSGTIKIAELKADTADVNIAGSGDLAAAGTAGKMDLNVMGAGSADMAGLVVDNAEVTIAGSGDASFSSDGKVDASIMGSGSVRVIGRATCTVNSMGSGKLVCENPQSSTPDAAAKAEPEKQAAKKSATKKRVAKKAAPKGKGGKRQA